MTRGKGQADNARIRLWCAYYKSTLYLKKSHKKSSIFFLFNIFVNYVVTYLVHIHASCFMSTYKIAIIPLHTQGKY